MLRMVWENSRTFREMASSSLASSLKNGIKMFPRSEKQRVWRSLV